MRFLSTLPAVACPSRLLAAALLAALTACSSATDKKIDEVSVQPAAPAAAPASVPAPAAAPSPDSAAVPSFDVSQVPVVSPKLGAFPYFSVLDGYTRMTPEMHPSGADYLKDVAFDKYEFFDGTRMIPVEGRLVTYKVEGKGASAHQVLKTYQKLVQDLGGVTVWEGKGDDLVARKLKFADGRHRGIHTLESEEFGTYVLRLPDREIWVEPYISWKVTPNDNYWLTVVERKALPMTAKLLPAEELKKALDANGHVAVYLNFDTDQATLRPDAASGIGEIVKLLQQDPALSLEVQGHTDNAGAFAHNQQLSTQRAQSVVAALTAQGIAAARLTPKGYGQTKPVADNATEEGKAKNRRVELVRR